MKLIYLQILFVLFFVYKTTNCFKLENQEALDCKINEKDSSRVAYTITVARSGGANFTTVKDAINSIPANNDRWIKIAISPGTYTEQIKVNVQCIFLQGQNRKSTIITFDAHDSTDKSITFDAFTHNFKAKGITFRNSYNVPYSGNSVPGVAFRAYGDKQAFYSCGFEGYQDTLWDDLGRHFYESCYIEGTTDFIWGEGASIYKGCSINVIGDGYITAQGRKSANDWSGYVFTGCTVTGQAHTLLGRAYTPFSTVIFNDTYFADIIKPEGWFIWEQSGHESDVTYAEMNCKGKGSNTRGRVKWMKKLSHPSRYDSLTFIDKDGWIQKTSMII